MLVVTFHIAGIADVNIQPAISIDIRHGHTRTPSAGSSHSCFFGYIFKLKVPFVEVQLIGSEVGRKIQIRKAIVIHISNGYPTPIVEVAVGKDIEVLVKSKVVLKADPRRFSSNLLK